MEKDEQYIIQLRDCFTAGYTLPQYCVDNGIKKPLFVSEEKHLQFIWEVYVQFRYDKRMTASFSVIDLPTDSINFSLYNIVGNVKIKNSSEINPNDFDAIILITDKEINFTKKAISLSKLTSYFTYKTYVKIPLLNFLQRYPQVKLILTKYPTYNRYKDELDFFKQINGISQMRSILRKDKSGTVKTPLDKFGYTNEEVLQLMEDAKFKETYDGTTIMEDNDNPLIRITNGKRETAYQPEHFQNKIYFVGSSHDFGVNAPYDKTIESYLQKMLNDNNLPYRVENESQHYYGRYQDIFYNLNNLTPAPGDIIFVWINNMRLKDLPFLDLFNAFDPPYDYKEIFCARGHFNELGYKILAEKYFKYLTRNKFFHDTEFNCQTPPPPRRYGIPPQFEAGKSKSSVDEELEAYKKISHAENEDLETYKKTLRAKKIPIGALVMNCDPFTLYHQYLVEYAAERVTKLYLFVVEEDKSEFPFADRIELVRQGVKHIPNVEVLPSGKFIISQQTFSGYFNKASLQDVAVDSSEDVEIFGKEIAPTLGITIRFAGEEPTDNVTRQYNKTMKEILPRYGVEFCEIPRKEFGDKPISASIVREALKRGDFDKIKNLVPDTTLVYLRGRYSMSK